MGKARRKEQGFLAFDLPSDRAQTGETVDVEISVQRQKKPGDVVPVLNTEKGGSPSIRSLAIGPVHGSQNVEWIGIDAPGTIKRGFGHMPGPARLRGQCLSEFDIVKRPHDAHMPPNRPRDPTNCFGNRP